MNSSIRCNGVYFEMVSFNASRITVVKSSFPMKRHSINRIKVDCFIMIGNMHASISINVDERKHFN